MGYPENKRGIGSYQRIVERKKLTDIGFDTVFNG
jgi:hypothetical protein